MSFSLNSMLATGGLTAAIVAGWQQVKSFASYVSSFVIVRARVDSGIRSPLYYHLKKNYKVLPSGLFDFRSRYMNLKGTKNTVTVPFRVTNSTIVFVRGLQLIIVNVSSMSISMVSLRGLVNFENIIREALKENRAEVDSMMEEHEKVRTRFQVIRVVGMEKGAWAAHGENRPMAKSGGTQLLSDSAESSSEETYILDVTKDDSFMYPRELFAQSDTTDPLENLFFEDNVLKYIEQAKQ